MTLTPFSRSHEGLDCWKWLVCTLSPEWMDGCCPNLYIYIVEACKRTGQILVTLTPFSRSHDGLDCWKMACLHPISWMNGWILTKLAQLHCWDRDKNWLYFGDLNPIFKVTRGLRFLENDLSAPYLLNEWMDLGRICTSILLWNGKEVIRFWWPWLHFQGHMRT